MLRRLALSVAVLLWWVPAQVFALGLGNIEMRSALNQPLDAQIELLRARPGELKDLAITLASADTFKRAGMERPNFLTQLQFEVVTNPSGAPYIQVKSVQPITEPFLNFLIEVNWPNGRLLREFTVLVDPPVVADRTPGAVESPVVGQTPEGLLVDQLAAEALGKAPPNASGAIEIPIPSRSKVAAAPEAPVTMPAPAEVAVEEVVAERAVPIEVPVEPERAPERPTVTKRAERPTVTKPEPEAVPEQVAEGGLEHSVKSKETLWEIARDMRPSKDVSIPQMMIALLENNPEAFSGNNMNNLKQGSVLRLQDASQATRMEKDEAARIADLQWEQWKESRGALVGSTPARTGRAPATPEATEARVKLVSPDAEGEEAGSSSPKAASVGGGRDISRLKKELALAQESLAAQRLETQDVRERMTSLEEQVTTMQRLVQLKDDQLAALQGQAATTTAEATAAAAKAAPATAGAAADKPADAPTPEAADAAKPVGMMAGLTKDPKLIGLAVVVGGIVVLLVWLVVRRRKMQQFQESILTLNESVSEQAFTQNKPESEDASFMSDFAVSSMEGIHTDVSEVDPLSEADVYLAYGRYKQAEELINQAIEKSPQRAELKMKLMEIQYAAKDSDGFALQAEMVHDTFAAQHPDMWSRVVEMGRELAPGNVLFGGDGQSSGSAMPKKTADAADEFDLGDLNFGDDLGTSAGGNDASLDFDMGEFKQHNKDQKKPAGTTAAARAVEEHSLDFDLSAIDDVTHAAAEPKAQDEASVTVDNGLDFDFSEFGQAEDAAQHPATAGPVAADDNGLDFDFGAGNTTPPAAGRDDNVVDFSFSQASSGADSEMMDQPHSDVALAEAGIDGELDDSLFADVDEVGTKLDLAKAYIDMGDSEGARSILDEVMEEGNDNQKQEAQVLIRQIG